MDKADKWTDATDGRPGQAKNTSTSTAVLDSVWVGEANPYMQTDALRKRRDNELGSREKYLENVQHKFNLFPSIF